MAGTAPRAAGWALSPSSLLGVAQAASWPRVVSAPSWRESWLCRAGEVIPICHSLVRNRGPPAGTAAASGVPPAAAPGMFPSVSLPPRWQASGELLAFPLDPPYLDSSSVLLWAHTLSSPWSPLNAGRDGSCTLPRVPGVARPCSQGPHLLGFQSRCGPRPLCGAAERRRRGGSRYSLSNSLKSPVAKNIFYLDIYF